MFQRKIKVLLLLSLVLLLLAGLPSVGWAAGDNTFKATNFQINVKPEYDDPRTLVIYQGDFSGAGTDILKKGTPISFIIPKGAEIGMACEINAQGGHDCQPYTTEDIGNNNIKLTWKTTKDIAPNQNYPAYLEFYYNNGSTAPLKTFDYQFKPTYNLDKVSLNIVAPKAATNFTTTPTAAVTGTDSDELNNYTFKYSNQTPTDAIAIKVGYSKADNKPTFNKPQTGANQSSATSGSSGSWLSKPEFLVPTLLLVAILAIGLIFGLGRGKGMQSGKANHTKAARKAAQVVNRNNGAKNSLSDPKQERKRLRQMLLDGKISEATYKQLAAEIDQENR